MIKPEAKCYLLHGSTGEYSDRSDWVVRGYLDKSRADLDCSMANTQAAQYFNMTDADGIRFSCGDEDAEEERRIRKETLIVDPNAQFDYTGTTYWVTECDLV